MSPSELEGKIRELRQLQAIIDETERFTKTNTTRRFCVA